MYKKIQDYILLTKPRVISLLLLVAVCSCLIGNKGIPNVSVIISIIIGGAFAAGGAGSLNMAYEHKIDKAMGRTKNRPVAEGRVTPFSASVWGILLNIFSFIILFYFINYIAASLAILGTILYFILYTVILKKRTSQNIVIGGAAGCIPALVGYSAGSNGIIDSTAIWLFLIIFVWTPPHFWALSIVIKKDYEKVGIPMLPVTKGINYTQINILIYSIITSIFCLILTFINQSLGIFYFFSTIIISIILILYSIKIIKTKENDLKKKHSLNFYKYSMLYLALIFISSSLDIIVFS
ncbi:MAG: protoheme IX farnesyltransferase [Chloroflexi bacterium]|nr:protoheme IX farnesyltransferase [Chloroflexota bacterium]|tara:strand:- start:930 stop:1814 length:885 start_codon:yes stop_codon:yes gene_type:complete